MRPAVRCEIVKWLDDEPQPGWVEARVTDAYGNVRTFRGKPPTFTAGIVQPDSRFPMPGVLLCEIVGRRRTDAGEVVSVRLIYVDEGEDDRMDIFAHQLTDGRRLAAHVRVSAEHPPTRQFTGFPPGLTDEADTRTPMPWPAVVIIDAVEDRILLLRYTAHGVPGGDTWHESIEEAKEQAALEYGELLGEWRDIPDEVHDLPKYVVSQARGAP